MPGMANYLTHLQHFILGIILFETLWKNCDCLLTESIFQRIEGVQLSYAYAILSARSRVQCLHACHEDNQYACVAVSYTNVTGACKLSDKWMDEPTVQITDELLWDIYFDRGKILHVYQHIYVNICE